MVVMLDRGGEGQDALQDADPHSGGRSDHCCSPDPVPAPLRRHWPADACPVRATSDGIPSAFIRSSQARPNVGADVIGRQQEGAHPMETLLYSLLLLSCPVGTGTGVGWS